jgi:Domain of unknown function (DU1801)
VLKHLRKAVHRHCPQAVEAIEWGAPYFLYREKILCGMGSFKKHCVFGFWKGSLMVEDGGERARIGMGQLRKITSVADLPSGNELAYSPVARQTFPLRHLPHACEHLVPGLGPGWSSVHVGGPCPLGSPHSASNPSRSSMLSSPAAGRLRTCSVPRRRE